MSTAVLRQGPRFHTLRKYKSTYMKRGFTRDKAGLIYKHLTLETTEDVGGILAVDSYGCAVQPARVRRPHLHPPARLPPPAPIPEILEEALTERGAPEVDARLLHRPLLRLRPQGNLLPQSAVRGLLHQLPDADMLSYPFWPQLYHGDQGLYPFLQGGQAQARPEQHLSPFHVGPRLTALVKTAVSI